MRRSSRVTLTSLALAAAVGGVALGQTPPASNDVSGAESEPASEKKPPEAEPPVIGGEQSPVDEQSPVGEQPAPTTAGVEQAPVIDTSAGATALADEARGWDEEPGVEDEDVALAIPRAILLVPRLAFEVVVWPIAKTARLVDEWNVIEYAERILYFDDKHEAGWQPTLSYRGILGLAAGAKLFHKSVFGHGERLELSAKFFGGYEQAYELSLEGNRIGGSRLWLDARIRYESELASLFGGVGMVEQNQPGTGLGPRDANHRTYFGQRRGLGLLRAGYTAGEVGELVKPGLAVITNLRGFSTNRSDRTQTEEVYDPTLIAGFEDDVKTLEVQANLVVDLRASAGLDSRGAYLEVFGGRALGVSGYEYWHYGAEASYTINLYRRTRLLTLRAALESVEAEPGNVPFSDLPRLGGPHRMRGYMEGEFRDSLATFASLEYQYPIHRNILGRLFIDAGRVSDNYEDLYDIGAWRVGYGGGLVLGNQDGVSLRLDLSYGEDFQVFLTGDVARAFDGRSAQL